MNIPNKTNPTSHVAVEKKINTTGMTEEMNKPKYMLPKSDFAKDFTMLVLTMLSLSFLARRRVFRYTNTEAAPIMRLMFAMFEPKTLPIESAAPPEKAAITATVNSGSDVENAISVKPTAVLPIRVMVETLTALLMARLLAQSKTAKDTAIIITFRIIELKKSTIKGLSY
jgi:hypothetical protein